MSLFFETLEKRYLYCGGSPTYDINHDLFVTPADVVAVIKSINLNESIYKPINAVKIINELNLCGPQEISPIKIIISDKTPKTVGIGYGSKIADLDFYIPDGRILDVELKFKLPLNNKDVILDSVVTKNGQFKIKDNLIWLKLDGNSSIQVIVNIPTVSSIGKKIELIIQYNNGINKKEISTNLSII